MTQWLRSGARTRAGGGAGRAYAAVDLGTNNCRLLIAEPEGATFRVVDSHSDLVRLGEGLKASGRLGAPAMARALQALRVCAAKIAERGVAAVRCVATQACRAAANGQEFLAQVRQETGLDFAIITPREEAELSVLGCAALKDPRAPLALVVDVGGGSTELSWVEEDGAGGTRIAEWVSLPVGVVSLAEEFGAAAGKPEGFARMAAQAGAALADFRGAERLRKAFADPLVHYIGASGTVTSLAGVSLRLPRYQRARIDGLWMSVAQTREASAYLRSLDAGGRAAHPCIGPQRADLVLPGAAILEAIFSHWPAERVRVADRGLREGLLTQMTAQARAGAG